MKWTTIFIVILLFNACKTTEEVEYEPTVLEVFVLDDLGLKIPGVTVKLFDDINVYEEAKRTGVTSESIGIAISNNEGVATFSNLNANSTFYLYIDHRDRVNLIDLNNFETKYRVSDNMEIGGTTNVTSQLSPAKSAVSFYISSDVADQYPITIYIGGDEVGTIEESFDGVPTNAASNGAFTYKINVGTKWWAKSATGCLYSGEVDVDGTESFTPIELVECNAGSVTFWVSESQADLLPIQLVLNEEDEAGSITISSITPTTCFGTDGLSLGREPGTYTYKASSFAGGCVQVDEFTIEQGTCQLIEITLCNE
jgi:hypothetical protein